MQNSNCQYVYPIEVNKEEFAFCLGQWGGGRGGVGGVTPGDSVEGVSLYTCFPWGMKGERYTYL